MTSLRLQLSDVSINQTEETVHLFNPLKHLAEGIFKVNISISWFLSFKISHDIILSVKVFSALALNNYTNSAPKGLKYICFCFPKQKKILCSFPKQVKIYYFVSITKNIWFVFPSKRKYCVVFPRKLKYITFFVLTSKNFILWFDISAFVFPSKKKICICFSKARKNLLVCFCK